MTSTRKQSRALWSLRIWVFLGTAVTTCAGTALLLIFARLQAGKWIWTDGFYLNGDQWFDAARTTVTLVGIIGLGGAAFLAYRKQRSAEATHLLEESSALRNRYTTCAEQLGHDNSAIRLAGVYALASLADDWYTFGNRTERQVCIDLLCAYLRSRRASQVGRQERDVRDAILTVIRDHTSHRDTGWKMCDFNLASADLEGANLVGVTMYFPDLTDANLTEANLTRAELYKPDLDGANLTRANLDGVNLINARNLDGANLTGIFYSSPPENWPDSISLPPSRDPY